MSVPGVKTNDLTPKERDALLELLASAFGVPEDAHGLFNGVKHERMLRAAQKKLFAQQDASGPRDTRKLNGGK